MKTSLKLTLGAMALGLSLSSFAQDNANTPAPATKADPKVMIQIPDSAIKSGKVIIKDGQVYVRIGKEGHGGDHVIASRYVTSGPGGTPISDM